MRVAAGIEANGVPCKVRDDKSRKSHNLCGEKLNWFWLARKLRIVNKSQVFAGKLGWKWREKYNDWI